MDRASGGTARAFIPSIVALACFGLAAAPAVAEETPTAPTFSPEELEQVVAPIALYPDALLAQVMMASTYPLEVVEAARFLEDNPELKDTALDDALKEKTWDPSVKSLVSFPQVLTMMNEKLDWTQKLGDAFLAQQDDLMDAVQRLRNKAHAEGNLESNEQQTVTVEPAPAGAAPPSAGPPQQTIIIQPANPQVVYVPTYNPTVVYGAWPYPAYPPYSYYPPGYMMATSMMSFGMGMWAGAALWGDCDWDNGGGGDKVKIDIDNYNNFNKTDIKNGKWNHNVDHRKGVQYRDQRTQNKYGKGDRPGAANREAFRGRADQGRRDIARQGPSAVQRDIGKGGARPSVKSDARPAKRSTRPAPTGASPGAEHVR